MDVLLAYGAYKLSIMCSFINSLDGILQKYTFNTCLPLNTLKIKVKENGTETYGISFTI
jgi:hypothetical protein